MRAKKPKLVYYICACLRSGDLHQIVISVTFCCCCLTSLLLNVCQTMSGKIQMTVFNNRGFDLFYFFLVVCMHRFMLAWLARLFSLSLISMRDRSISCGNGIMMERSVFSIAVNMWTTWDSSKQERNFFFALLWAQLDISIRSIYFKEVCLMKCTDWSWKLEVWRCPTKIQIQFVRHSWHRE